MKDQIIAVRRGDLGEVMNFVGSVLSLAAEVEVDGYIENGEIDNKSLGAALTALCRRLGIRNFGWSDADTENTAEDPQSRWMEDLKIIARFVEAVAGSRAVTYGELELAEAMCIAGVDAKTLGSALHSFGRAVGVEDLGWTAEECR